MSTALKSRTIYSHGIWLPLALLSVLLATGKAQAISPTPFLTLTGAAARDGFGVSVSGADVNGDGYDDLLIGAPFANLRTGRAYVYFGAPRMDSIPDAILRDERIDSFFGPSSLFGWSVAGIGDVNRDGRADMAVGNPFVNCSSGAVGIFWGANTIHGQADLHVTALAGGCSARFGFSISPAGDLNEDGYGDVLIGAPGGRTEASSAGLAFVMYGGANPDSTPNVAIGSPLPSTFDDFYGFGYSAAPVGDVNGDGKSDIVIAQGIGPLRSLPPVGAAYLYLGGKPLTVTPDATLEARLYDSYYNYGEPGAVAPAGDLNGDGYDDFLVRGNSWNCSPFPGGTQCIFEYGVFLYFGAARVNEIPTHGLFLRGDYASAVVAGGRDTNGDGHPDFVIGNGKRAFVYFGGPALDSIPDVTLEPVVAGSNFGASVAMADVTGDGIAEVIVGALGTGSPTSDDPGHVYVYNLSVPLASHAFVRGDRRVIPLTDASSQVRIQYEPVNGDYQNVDVDVSSLRLVSPGIGAVSEIAASPAKGAVQSDTDQDGVPELSALFARSDLARLFSLIRGHQSIDVALKGVLQSGREFRAPLTLTVIGTGKPGAVVASLAPNPLNPRATLTFSMETPGPTTVRLYDLRGRCVRTVIAAEQLPVGVHRIDIDGRDQRGATLASGVYFYRVETPGGASTGRFVVLK
jgi:hypothetical protein